MQSLQLAILLGVLVILSGLSFKKRDWVFAIFLFFFFYNCTANYASDVLMGLFTGKRPSEIAFTGVQNVHLYIRASAFSSWTFAILLTIAGIALCVPRMAVIRYRAIKRGGQQPPALLLNRAKKQFVRAPIIFATAVLSFYIINYALYYGIFKYYKIQPLNPEWLLAMGIFQFVGTYLTLEFIVRLSFLRYFDDGFDNETIQKLPNISLGLKLFLILVVLSVTPVLFVLLSFADFIRSGNMNTITHDMSSFALGVIVLLVIVSVTLALYLSWNIRGPLKKLAETAKNVENGIYKSDAKAIFPDEVGLLITQFNQMVNGLREREFIKETFGRYVTKQVAEKILGGHLELGGEEREVTVLFSDIRGFTSLSEKQTPSQVVSMLNEYFTSMVDAIFDNDGILDKYIGDAVMALFGSPIITENHALQAVKAALQMREKLAELNRIRASRGEPPIRNGIGINTGVAVVGNIGSPKRTEYTVIGDAVNLTSRLESLTKEYDVPIIISTETKSLVNSFVTTRFLGSATVKGKEKTVDVYEVIGWKNP